MKILKSFTQVNFLKNKKEYSFCCKLFADYEIQNLLGAIVLTNINGLSLKRVLESIKYIQKPKGRLKKVSLRNNNFSIYIDYAHTPDSLKKSLEALKFMIKPSGRLSLVFGCGGERDKGKRKIMGKIANKLADKIIITDDNPRFENAKAIRNEIAIYCERSLSIADRKKAIYKAISNMNNKDILLIAGKGYETYQDTKGKKNYFDDELGKTNNKKDFLDIIWDSFTLKKLLNAESSQKWEATGVEIDSRKVKKGDLFCAINGPNHNGHDYINVAAEKGASACLVSEDKITKGNIVLSKVSNVLNSIALMAKYSRKRSKAEFIAITGSVGKTGTKDMIKSTLSELQDTYANESSFNNQIGVPLSLSRVPPDVKYCILELGMNKRGEIRKLSKLVKPDVAILTAIEIAHLEGLKSLKNIAKAKSEILENLSKQGCLIINYDTNYSDYVIKKAEQLGIKNIITYGKKNKCNINLLNYKLKNNKYFVDALYFGKKISWIMPCVGEQWVLNSLSVVALASYFRINLKKP